MTRNPHARSATMRAVATVAALGVLHSKGCRDVLSIWGSKRDLTLAKFLNRSLPQSEQLKMTVWRPVVVPKDITRSFPEAVTTADPADYDGFLWGDIYMLDIGVAINPKYLATIVREDAPGVWMGHAYEGVMGTTEEEGAWIRQDGLVVSKPDSSVGRPYPPHPDANWLTCDGQSDGVVWATVTAVSQHLVVLIQRTKTTVSMTRDELSPRVGWVDLPFPVFDRDTYVGSLGMTIASLLYTPGCRDLARLFLSFWPKHRVYVHKKIYSAAKADVQSRARTSFTLSVLNQQVSSLVQTDAELKLIYEIFPEEYSQLQYNIVFAAFVAEAKNHADMLASAAAQHGGEFEDTRVIPGKISERPSSRSTVRYLLGAAGLCVLVWWLRRRASVGSLAGVLLRMGTELKRRQQKSALPDTKPAPWVVQQYRRLQWAWGTSSLPGVEWCRQFYRTARYQICDAVDTMRNNVAEFKRGMNIAREVQKEMRQAQEAVVVAAGKDLSRRNILKAVFTVVVGAPMVEETIKEFTGSWGTGIIILVEFLKDLHALGPMPALLRRLPSTAMHLACHTLRGHLVARIALHAAFNGLVCWSNPTELLGVARQLQQRAAQYSIATGSLSFALAEWGQYLTARAEEPAPSRWSEFVRHYHDAPWEDRQRMEEVQPCVSTFPLEQSIIPKQTVSFYEPKSRCDLLKLKIKYTPVVLLADGEWGPPGTTEYTRPRQHVFTFLPTCVPIYSPDKSDANLWGMIAGRVLVEAPMDPRKQGAAWATVSTGFVPQQLPIVYEEVEEEWWDHVSGDTRKKKRLLSAKDQLKNGPLPVYHPAFMTVTLMLKTDEVLLKWWGIQMGMKGRCIANVSPLVQVLVGPPIYAATQRLKKMWGMPDCDPQVRLPHPLWLTYGAAMNDQDLSRWLATVMAYQGRLPEATFILVAGDDSLVVHHHEGSTTFYEADASMADQSESYGPLLTEYSVLHKLGVSHDITDILFRVAHAKYKARSQSGWAATIDRTSRPMRDTGGADTSLGNSIVFGLSWKEVAARGYDLAHFVVLGLRMKVRQTNDPRAVTFLKGMWYRTDREEFVWGPLPSRILKAGKSLKDPRVIYRKHGGRRDLRRAYELFAHDIAASYAGFVQVPILQAFVQRYAGSSPALISQEEHEPWKVSSSGVYRDHKLVNVHQVAQRYGLSDVDIGEMEEQLLNSEVLTFLEHQGYWKLAEVDYN